MTHYCDHEDIAHDYYGRNIWIDLGDGEAMCASHVRELDICRPWPPSLLRDCGYRIFLDQETWGVRVVNDRNMVSYRLGFFSSEAAARALARQIIAKMQAVVDG